MAHDDPQDPKKPQQDPANVEQDSLEAQSEAAKLGLLQRLKSELASSRGMLMVNWVNFGDGIVYFGMLNLLTLFMSKDVGMTTQMSTMSVSVFTGLVTLFMLGAGSLTDWLGARRALIASLAIALVGRIILVMAPGFVDLTLVLSWTAIAIMGFGEGAIQPAMYAGVKEYSSKASTTMGFAYLYAVMNLGIVVGEFASPLVREWYAAHIEGKDLLQDPAAGITGAFWFFVALNAIILVVTVVFFNKKVEARDRVQVADSEKKTKSSFLQQVRSLPIMDLRFMFFIFILLPVRTLFAHQWLTMPIYVNRVFPNWVAAKWEWLGMINPLVIVVTVPLIAALTQKKRVVDMMIVGTAISALSTFLLLPGPNLILLIAYIMLFTLGEAVWSSRFMEYVAGIAPAGRLGIYMGLAGLPWFLAKTLTGTYAGTLLDRFVPEVGVQSPGTLWMIYGATAVISPLGLVLARRWLLAREPTETAPEVTH